MQFTIEFHDDEFHLMSGDQIIARYTVLPNGYKGQDRHTSDLERLAGVLGLDPESAEDDDLEEILDAATGLADLLHRKIYG